MEHPPTTAPVPALHTKQYVFVDEYNRHKRLKVMRACDGCRKRKIRCDGALQNGPWPCGACVRLKLKCIPPTLDQDEDQHTSDAAPSQHQFSFQNTTFPANPPITSKPTASYPPQPQHALPPMVHDWSNSVPPAISTTAPTASPVYQPQHHFNSSAYPQQTYNHQTAGPRLGPIYTNDDYSISPSAHSNAVAYAQNGQTPSLLRSETVASGSSSGDPQEIDATVRELSEQMGDLTIDITSQATYIKRAQALADSSGIEEAEVLLPASVFADSTVRIPPEMMPSEEQAMDYFGYFFNHIHPYVPVLDRGKFYDEWRTARSGISPLLLEGIFACVARYLEEPLESRKWLALAERHEEIVKDVPRLGTIQALVILLKARESISKRGYYYRSWMTVKYMTTMAMDLGLHEHYDQHRSDDTCAYQKAECMVRTRVWQSLFVLEILVGAPLGRSDFSIEVENVQFNTPYSSADVDAFEHLTSRRSTYMAESVRNIKVSNQLWQTMKRYKKDWALDPAFVRHNEDLPKWLRELPQDFQLHFPEDGSPPWLGGDHFVAHLHTYHHLVVIMHHRPQLQALLEKRDPGWKTHLDVCLLSASQMCRIEEALYRDFGFHGLQFMIRGVNYTIYCILTCTMLHLAAITCPDPVMNTQARMYFTRHMRVLEHCLPSSTPEMRVQINALREAFSADTSQSFELKPTLGLRSPSMENQSTPSSTHSNPVSAPILTAPPTWSNIDATSSKALTPATEYGPSFDNVPPHAMTSRPPMIHHSSSFDMPTNTAYTSQGLQQVTTAPSIGYALEPVISGEGPAPVWDPSGIFNQWNTAFGPPPPPQPSPPDPRRMQPTSAPLMPNQQSPVGAQSMYSAAQQLPVANATSVVPDNAAPAMPTVTPLMWQDAFTSAYVSGHGQKRYREASVDHSAYGQYSNTNKRRG